MRIVHGISSRTSLDLDFSLEKDFDNLADIQARMERALVGRFAPLEFVPFDVKLLPKPSDEQREAAFLGGVDINLILSSSTRRGFDGLGRTSNNCAVKQPSLGRGS